jgi:hypothetical protein
MAQASLTEKKPVSGGSGRTLHLSAGVVLKITPLRGSALDFDEYKLLTRYQEYLSNDYCISCAYFQIVKGHFGICPDLPMRKAYDGTKKGSGCALWRLRTIYLKYGIKQRLPEKPTIRQIRLKVVHRKPRIFRTKWRNYSRDVREPWFWHWRLPKFVYDFLKNPEPLPDSIDLREPYGHYSDKLVWRDGKFRSKNPMAPPIIKICRQCGKRFEQQPNTKGLYCSQICFHKHRQAELHSKSRLIN